MIDPTAPSSGAAPPTAQTVTILFSDIRGFTEFTDAHGDDAAYRMLQQHNLIVREQIELYGGHVVKTQGDSFMVSFSAARTAVSCAVGMQRALARFNETQAGRRIEIGIGINLGEPVHEGADFFGGTVNLAARICAVAGPGEILVSELVHRIVGRLESVEFVDLGPVPLKGFHDPQRLAEVRWREAGADAPARGSTVSTAPVGSSAGGVVSTGAASPAPSRSRRWFGAVAMAVVAGLAGGGWYLSTHGGVNPGGTAPPATASPRSSPVAGAGSPRATGSAQAAAGPPAAATPSPSAATARPPSATSPSPVSGAAVGSPAAASPGPDGLLRADDFSDASHGLFLGRQQFHGQGTLAGNESVDYDVLSEYRVRALHVRLTANYPASQPANGPGLGATVLADDRLLEDAAVEVTAESFLGPGQVAYGLCYQLDNNQGRYCLNVRPSQRSYALLSSAGPALTLTRSSAILSGANRLRIELRGDTLTVLINGQEVDQAQLDGLDRRRGRVGVFIGMFGAAPAGAVEARFNDFRVYSLTNGNQGASR